MGAADKFDYNASIAQALMGTHIPMEPGKLSYFSANAESRLSSYRGTCRSS